MISLIAEILSLFVFIIFKPALKEVSCSKDISYKVLSILSILGLVMSLLLIILHWTHYGPVKLLFILQIVLLSFVGKKYSEKIFYWGFLICFLFGIYLILKN